ncbi:hypothetical protein PZA11_006532 [Diplocarpon coronariae]
MADSSESYKDLVLSTAKLGEETSAKIIDFVSQYPENQAGMVNISIGLKLASANLRELYSTLDKYGSKIQLDDNLTQPLVAVLRAIFMKAAKALEEGIEAEKDYGDEWESLERVGGAATSRAMQSRRPCSYTHAGCMRFMRVLGGFEQADELVWYLEKQKGHLFYVIRAIRYLSLKNLEAEGALDAGEKVALKKLSGEAANIAGQIAWRKEELGSLAERVKAGENLADQGRHTNEAMIIPRARGRADDDARSWRSVDSFESDAFIEGNEIYEAWVIRTIEGYARRIERSWSFYGLKIHEHLINEVFTVDSVPCSQEEMKNKYQASETRADSRLLAKKIASLSSGVYREIEWLIQERMRITTVPKRLRTWKLIDIKPAPPLIPRQPTTWLNWIFGRSEMLDHLIVLKAESFNVEGLTYPNRIVDPFRKIQHRAKRRLRSRSPVERFRVVEDSYEQNPITANRRRSNVEILPNTTPEEAQVKIEDMLAEILASGKESLLA